MQVDEILAAIEKPLNYIRKDKWANLGRVVDLEKSLRPPIENLKKSFPRKQRIADSMAARLRGYDNAPPEEKKARIRDMAELISDIRAPSKEEIKRSFEELDTKVQWVKGVGPAIGEKLARLNIKTVEDLLFTLPRNYEDRRNIVKISKLKEGCKAGFVATVAAADRTGRFGRNFEAFLQDETGVIAAKWFQGINWIEKKIKVGSRLFVYGEVKRYRDNREIHHPEVTVLDEDESPEAAILPVYPATEGLTQYRLRKICAHAVENYAHLVPELLPGHLREELGLPELADAFRMVHTPPKDADIESLRRKTSAGHRRLVFDEFLILQVGLALKRKGALKEPAWPIKAKGKLGRRVASSMPFKLTEAQKKTVRRIWREIEKDHPMNLLLQGDVGSGKTLVAMLGALFAVEAGYQAAIMAPTEILAEQHWRNFNEILKAEGVNVHLLTGKTPSRRKENIREKLSGGEPCIIVGTHAVLSEPVNFHKLAYAVVDEQHRFGVHQRMSLKAKGGERVPHTLVMTATPIPRTLTMTIYGDLDLAVIDEMPPGRKPVETHLVKQREIKGMWESVRAELAAGRQAFVVYPLIEESEHVGDLYNATERAQYLARKVFPDFRVGLVHGKMKPEDRENVMRDFAAGKTRLLVATTVVEVGIDVPAATVMVIEHAERFGLSQLHQLRGRVGRGAHPGKCYLVVHGPIGAEARRRLKIMTETSDGFRIAEEDLAIRGPGEFLGTRQSGMPDFRVANIARDGQVLIDAKERAARIVETDPGLKAPRHVVLRSYMRRLWKGRLSLAGVG